MKNIHVLPTDKPSRLIFNSFHKSFCYQKEIDGMYINDGKVSGADFWGLQKALNNGFKPQNIYITSDEEDINDNDYIITKDGILVQVSHLLFKYLEGAYKVVLTTDQDLIADGVQAIDDEFLEWFVKNPSCEFVEVEKDKFFESVKYNFYKIIIPKEEEPISLPVEYKNVNRIEVINHSGAGEGREYVKYNISVDEIQLQDDGQTLKIFLK